MTDQEDQLQKADRLREQIERLKSGRPIKRPDQAKSLREQISDRANRFSVPAQPKPPKRP